MASSASGSDDYQPAYLSYGHGMMDPSVASFFNDQSSAVKYNSSPPTTSTSNTAGYSQLGSKPPPPFMAQGRMKPALLSAPTFPGSQPFPQVLRPTGLVDGNTIYASPCLPNSEPRFEPVGKTTHLGTVTASPCIPNRSCGLPFQGSCDTVAATPLRPYSNPANNLYHIPGSPYGFPPHRSTMQYPPPRPNFYWHAPPQSFQPAAIPRSSPMSYDGSLDLGYSSNYSTMSPSPNELTLPYKPTENTAMDHYAAGDYEYTGFGAYLNDLHFNTQSDADEPATKKLRTTKAEGSGTMPKALKPGKAPSVKRKCTKRKASTDYVTPVCENDLPSNGLLKEEPKSPFPSGFGAVIPEADRQRSSMTFEKGTFIFRIATLDGLEESGDVLWCVESNELLQKYTLKNIDHEGNREYTKTNKYCDWTANGKWLYHPAGDIVRSGGTFEPEYVVIGSIPSKESIMKYRAGVFNEKIKEGAGMSASIDLAKREDSNVPDHQEEIECATNFSPFILHESQQGIAGTSDDLL